MRPRVCVLASALAMLASLVAAGVASAASPSSNQLTITAAPNPVSAGDAVVIYGQLSGPNNSGQTVSLYHHVIGSGQSYTYVTRTMTDSFGRYEFVRPEGLVYTNRNWYVQDQTGDRSPITYEHVSALVSIAASTTNATTNHNVLFSGRVTPNHRFEQVYLQEQIGPTDDWRTLRSTTLNSSSSYLFAHRWRRPGIHEVRVLFGGDSRNARGTSDPVTVDVQQAQVPGFTIKSSSPVVTVGGSVTISGALTQPSTANSTVVLWGRSPDHRFAILGSEQTGPGGRYSFTQSGLTANMVYFVATPPTPNSARHQTALLNQGVQDLLTMTASTTSANSGQVVTFTGTVSPDKTGHVIYLEKLGKDGDFYIVEAAIVQPGSKFQFNWTLGAPGSYEFRAKIFLDERNIGAPSRPPITITATPASPSSVPPTS